MPDFDFDAYNHDTVQDGEGGMSSDAPHSNHSPHTPASSPVADSDSDEMDEPASRPAPPPAVHTPIVTTHTSSAAGEEVDKW
jgi:hypothetical protein